MHRFFLDFNKLGAGEIELFDKEFVFQVFKVLRFRVGETLILFNQNSDDFIYKIIGVNKNCVRLSFLSSVSNVSVSKRKIRLFFSMTKQMEKMEFVLQKCTELGVSEFFPLISQRTERGVLEKKERLLRILKEATEQCGENKIPLLHEERELKDEFLSDRKGFVPVFAHLNGDDFIYNKFMDFCNIDIFIGPEGGFSDEEFVSAKKFGFNCLKFSERVFRAETASIAISSLFLLS